MTTYRGHFSVRHLLLLTTLVSVAMLLAVKWTPLFLVGGFWLLYVVAMFGVFHLTSEKRPTAAALTWLLSGATLIMLAVYNLYRIPRGGARFASNAEWATTILVSLVIGGIGVLGLYRARRAYDRVSEMRTRTGRDVSEA